MQIEVTKEQLLQLLWGVEGKLEEIDGNIMSTKKCMYSPSNFDHKNVIKSVLCLHKAEKKTMMALQKLLWAACREGEGKSE